jgi:regulator of nucleoside diphosphate kinase
MPRGVTRPAARQPGIYITATDHDRLSTMAGGSSRTSAGGALLRDKLDHAVVLAAGEPPRRVAKLESVVRYQDDGTGKTRTVQLVLPGAADIDENRISVFTPVGAALLGVAIGQTFAWEADDGSARSVTILELEDRPPDLPALAAAALQPGRR